MSLALRLFLTQRSHAAASRAVPHAAVTVDDAGVSAARGLTSWFEAADRVAQRFIHRLIWQQQPPQMAVAGGMVAPLDLGPAAPPPPQLEGAADDGAAGGFLVWDGILNAAVPKRRTTRSVKRQRNQHKYLTPRRNIVTCEICGHSMLRHHLCKNCTKILLNIEKQQRRELAARSSFLN
jgi:ribosomal protein L32